MDSSNWFKGKSREELEKTEEAIYHAMLFGAKGAVLCGALGFFFSFFAKLVSGIFILVGTGLLFGIFGLALVRSELLKCLSEKERWEF